MRQCLRLALYLLFLVSLLVLGFKALEVVGPSQGWVGVRGHEISEGFVPDGVTGTETDPLGDGTVLLLRLGKLLLDTESLVALCGDNIRQLNPLNILCDAPPPTPIRRSQLIDGNEKNRRIQKKSGSKVWDVAVRTGILTVLSRYVVVEFCDRVDGESISQNYLVWARKMHGRAHKLALWLTT